MSSPNYSKLVADQRTYFYSGATRSAAWRREQLEALKGLLEDNRDGFYAALQQDLRRNEVDAELMDVGFCIKEAEYALKHMKNWMKVTREPTPLVLEPGHVRVRRDPLGVTLKNGGFLGLMGLSPKTKRVKPQSIGRGGAPE